VSQVAGVTCEAGGNVVGRLPWTSYGLAAVDKVSPVMGSGLLPGEVEGFGVHGTPTGTGSQLPVLSSQSELRVHLCESASKEGSLVTGCSLWVGDPRRCVFTCIERDDPEFFIFCWTTGRGVHIISHSFS